jgi:hypothetical protein
MKNFIDFIIKRYENLNTLEKIIISVFFYETPTSIENLRNVVNTKSQIQFTFEEIVESLNDIMGINIVFKNGKERGCCSFLIGTIFEDLTINLFISSFIEDFVDIPYYPTLKINK